MVLSETTWVNIFTIIFILTVLLWVISERTARFLCYCLLATYSKFRVWVSNVNFTNFVFGSLLVSYVLITFCGVGFYLSQQWSFLSYRNVYSISLASEMCKQRIIFCEFTNYWLDSRIFISSRYLSDPYNSLSAHEYLKPDIKHVVYFFSPFNLQEPLFEIVFYGRRAGLEAFSVMGFGEALFYLSQKVLIFLNYLLILY